MNNKFLVGLRGDDVVILKFNLKISAEDAMELAAWLKVMAEATDTIAPGSFEECVKNVENS